MIQELCDVCGKEVVMQDEGINVYPPFYSYLENKREFFKIDHNGLIFTITVMREDNSYSEIHMECLFKVLNDSRLVKT